MSEWNVHVDYVCSHLDCPEHKPRYDDDAICSITNRFCTKENCPQIDTAPPIREVEGMGRDELELIKQHIEKADKFVGELCTGERRWTMSVPVRPEEDSDLVIARALREAMKIIESALTTPAPIPVERLTTEQEYQQAMTELNRLVDIVGAYESEHYPIGEPGPEAEEEFRRDQMGEVPVERLEAGRYLMSLPVNIHQCEYNKETCPNCKTRFYVHSNDFCLMFCNLEHLTDRGAVFHAIEEPKS